MSDTFGEPCDVSIHAPARGATIRRGFQSHVMQFQSTRPRGARRVPGGRLLNASCFNPRARAGRDERPEGQQRKKACFNPRARAGRDQVGRVEFHGYTFQSTRPRGARLSCNVMIGNGFQSTRPRGARQRRKPETKPKTPVSIHAPARGATIIQHVLERDRICFNPRARAGRDSSLTERL